MTSPCEPCDAGFYADEIEHTCEPTRDAMRPVFGDAVCSVCKAPTWRPAHEDPKVCLRQECQRVKAFAARYWAGSGAE